MTSVISSTCDRGRTAADLTHCCANGRTVADLTHCCANGRRAQTGATAVAERHAFLGVRASRPSRYLTSGAKKAEVRA